MSTKIIPRWSTDRGNTDLGWLKSFHTFSVAQFHDPEHMDFGPIKVINEDRVEPGTGFGPHPHREFEIFSYLVSGQLEHGDTMGNTEIMKRGDIQLTSAGTGIRHSEKTYGKDQVHFLQIWVKPWKTGLTPKYFTRHFTDDEKKDRWARIVAPVGAASVVHEREGSGPTPIQAPLTVYAALLSPSKNLAHAFLPSSTAASREHMAFIQVIQTSGYNTLASQGAAIKIVGDGVAVELREGDSAYILGEEGKEIQVCNVGDKVAELLLFDVE